MLPLLGVDAVRVSCRKLAETVWSPLIVNVQPPVPEQAPPQPAKPKPFAGVSESVTEVPASTAIWQVAPQLTPPPVTVPFTGGMTVSRYCRWNDAETVWFWVIVT